MSGRCGQLALLLLFCSSGCSHNAAAAIPANTLVLELGGANPSLQEAMRRLGVQPKPERLPAEAPPPADPTPDLKPSVTPVTLAPADEPTVLEVKLEKGQSLYELARKHLGSASRWKEIADFNHFDEARLNRLREGTIVRIPLSKR